MTTSHLFESFSTTAERPKVDRESNVIRGAALMQIGQIKDSRGWYVDEVTLQQALKISGDLPANQQGVLSNFKHRVRGVDSLGNQVGFWNAFRIDGETFRGDLNIVKAAFSSVAGNIGEYLLDLSDDLPESFGVSADAILDRQAMKRDTVDGKVPIRLKGIRSFDVVDDPATTHTGMFGKTDSNEGEVERSGLTEEILNVLSDLGLFKAKENVMNVNSENGDAVADENTDVELTAEEKTNAVEAAKQAKLLKAKEDKQKKKDAEKKTDPQSEFVINGKTYRQVDETEKEPAGAFSQQSNSGDVEAERLRCQQITALCELAKCPDRKDTFINANFSVQQVQDTLSKFSTIQNQVIGAGLEEEKEGSDDDPDAQFKKQYAESKAALGDGFDLSEEDFIASAKISAGGGIVK